MALILGFLGGLVAADFGAAAPSPPTRRLEEGDSSGGTTASSRRNGFEAVYREALSLLQAYLAAESPNPPGKEAAAAEVLEDFLTREGIAVTKLEAVPGRPNLVAKVAGSGAGKPLILLQHLDVAPPTPGRSAVTPGSVRDGAVWGAGAVDMKGLGTAQAVALALLRRSGLSLARDVWLVAAADEEAGGRWGVEWLVVNRRELFRGAGLVLAEGGVNLVGPEGTPVFVGLEVRQKVPLWLELKVHGPASHGALQLRDAAGARLVRALHRVLTWRRRPRLLPEVEEFFHRLAEYQEPRWREVFREIEVHLEDPHFDVDTLGPYFGALVQDTVNLTTLRSSDGPNVVPAEATAVLDCRLLWDRRPDDFLGELEAVIDDPAVEIRPVLRGEAAASKLPREAADAVLRALLELGAEAAVGPAVQPGFTDARFFRRMGIPAVGFNPFPLGDVDGLSHADGEHLPLDAFRFGLEWYVRTVAHLAGVDPEVLLQSGAAALRP